MTPTENFALYQALFQQAQATVSKGIIRVEDRATYEAAQARRKGIKRHLDAVENFLEPWTSNIKTLAGYVKNTRAMLAKQTKVLDELQKAEMTRFLTEERENKRKRRQAMIDDLGSDSALPPERYEKKGTRVNYEYAADDLSQIDSRFVKTMLDDEAVKKALKEKGLAASELIGPGIKIKEIVSPSS